MSYGLRVRDASGNITLDTTQEIFRIIYQGSHGSSGSIYLPDYDANKGFVYVVTAINYATYYYEFNDTTKTLTFSLSYSSSCAITVVMVR